MCKSFAVCKKLGTRQIMLLCRVLNLYREFFAWAHGKHHVCRVPEVCRVLYLLAHGKSAICRVPVFVHTAKPWAHGILEVYGSLILR